MDNNNKIKTGVYTITNLVNNKMYVGGAWVSFDKRKKEHFNGLKANRHPNKYLQRSYNKYGKDNFVFEVLEECEPEYVQSFEQFWINTLEVVNDKHGYNMCPRAGSTIGKIIGQQQRDNISKALKGLLAGDKHPLWGTKRTPTMLGKKHTEEAKIKMSTFQKTRVRSQEELDYTKSKMNRGDKHHYFGKKREWLGELNKITKIGPKPNLYKPITKFDLNGNFIENYPSLTIACEKNNIKYKGHVCQNCKGKRNSAHGFIWKYTVSQSI